MLLRFYAGKRMAPQVGFEPTTLRLTAVFVLSTVYLAIPRCTAIIRRLQGSDASPHKFREVSKYP
jgi:hypothetical protein